jgi:hypothetical protein
MNLRDALIPAATTAALLFISSDYLVVLIVSGILARTTLFGLLVFAAQPVKTGVILLVGELRRAGTSDLLDIYGAELLLLPSLTLVYVLFGITQIPVMFVQLILGWIIGVSFAVPVMAAYRVGASMLHSGKLTKVIPSCLIVAEVGILFLNSANAAATSGGSLASVAKGAIGGYSPIGLAGPVIFADLVGVYVLLLLYATLGWEPARKGLGPRPFLVGILATGGTAAWILAVSSFPLPLPFLLVPPALAITAATWLVGREA